jgi:thioredoxin-like negative regulator of GroEL
MKDHDTESFTMLWDESFISWQVIGITSQPSAVMLAPDGTPIDGWVGMYPEDTVLELAAQYSSG